MLTQFAQDSEATHEALHTLLNAEVLAAQAAGLEVLYCVGETSEEQEQWEEVLGNQVRLGLAQADLSRVTIAYEPVWA